METAEDNKDEAKNDSHNDEKDPEIEAKDKKEVSFTDEKVPDSENDEKVPDSENDSKVPDSENDSKVPDSETDEKSSAHEDDQKVKAPKKHKKSSDREKRKLSVLDSKRRKDSNEEEIKPVRKKQISHQVIFGIISFFCFLILVATVSTILCLTDSYTFCPRIGSNQLCSLPENIAENGRLIDINTGQPPQDTRFEPYTTLIYYCEPGYKLSSASSLTSCKDDGSWTIESTPSCSRKYKKCDQTTHVNPTKSGAAEPYSTNGGIINIYCDYITAGGGWIVILKRTGGAINFFRDFAEYEKGFGNVNSEFWLGLFQISVITKSRKFEMRVDLEDFDGHQKFAHYSSFEVEAAPSYQLTVGGYSGDAGDSLTVSNGMSFSARNNDQDESATINCAARFQGGWWYKACHEANLLGRYLGGPHDSYGNGVNWRGWRGYHYSLRRAEMKIRPL